MVKVADPAWPGAVECRTQIGAHLSRLWREARQRELDEIREEFYRCVESSTTRSRDGYPPAPPSNERSAIRSGPYNLDHEPEKQGPPFWRRGRKSRDIPPLQKPKMSKTELQSLEPSEADFRRRDAAGLCIDCGEASQPARRAGEAKTPKHHRCDPCRRVYGSRHELRRLLCDTNHLHYVADVPDAVCSWCGQPIAIDVFHYSYPAPEPATSLRRACDRCVHDARFEIAPAASVVQVDVLPFDTSCIPSFCSIRSRRKPPDTPAVP